MTWSVSSTHPSIQTDQAVVITQTDKVKETTWNGCDKGCDREGAGEGLGEIEGGAILLHLLLLEHHVHRGDRGHDGGPWDHAQSMIRLETLQHDPRGNP